MFSVLQKIFGQGGGSQEKPLTDLDDEDIPRYPPFAKGLPVAPVEKVLETQRELINRIRATLGYTKDDFQRLVEPVLYRYATVVHLLPASEAHHHRGAGGLFRHGLEVAFWAAQASEAVIFSIEGTPLERRSNEPRWRLASCFAGLLHDVGKPLSDVSVTDKDGAKSWNPYSESLVDWAARHKIERYFIRWRGKRHKRHEQFSLLTLERILTQDALEYLSASGPEIVEAMLEAIAGTGVNQPITKLMLRADQESVSRDMRQSRLAVDEYSYGVPVERYVFDAIRRLIKTGQWKVNEAGAKVWHLHQGVFLAWKQGVSQIYELIDKDNIPGIPRDPDTLADILIERGFAVPNRVEEKGEGAYYRYWEVQPKLLEEGAVAASVKLLMLRLDSSDLVFTNEPPAPVAGEVVGEAVEPELTFEPTEEEPAAAASDAEVTEIGPEPDSSSLPGVDSAMPGSGASLPAATQPAPAQAEEASPHEIAAAAPPLSPDNPLQALAEATGNIGGIDFPFDAFGASATDVASEQTPAPESNTDRAHKAGTSGGASDEASAIAPAKPPHHNVQHGEPAENPVPEPIRHSAPEEASVEAAPQSQEARKALSQLLAGMGDARPLLEKAIDPVLEGQQTLGEVLYLAESKVVLLYPEGARALGAPADVLSTLFEAGAIVPDPIMPGRKVRDFNGIKALSFTDELSAAMVAAIREIEDAIDPYQDMLALVKKQQPSRERKRSGSKTKRRNKATPDSRAPGPSKASQESTKPKPVPPEQRSRERRATPNAKPSSDVPPTAAGETQNVARLPKEKAQKSLAKPTPKPAAPPVAKETDSVAERRDDVALLERRPLETPVDEDLFLPPKMAPEEAVRLLKEMIRKRSGRWLVTPVLEEDGDLRTSAKALEKIAGEYPGQLSKTALKTQIALNNGEPALRIRQGQLILKVN